MNIQNFLSEEPVSGPQSMDRYTIIILDWCLFQLVQGSELWLLGRHAPSLLSERGDSRDESNDDREKRGSDAGQGGWRERRGERKEKRLGGWQLWNFGHNHRHLYHQHLHNHGHHHDHCHHHHHRENTQQQHQYHHHLQFADGDIGTSTDWIRRANSPAMCVNIWFVYPVNYMII